MRQWFGSDPNGTVSSAQADVRVNGRFEVSFANADGDRYTCFGTYLDVEPGKRLAFTWSWTSRPGSTERVKVSLEPEQGGTSMSFEHADIDPQTTHDYAAGWRRTFDKLENVLQRHGRNER